MILSDYEWTYIFKLKFQVKLFWSVSIFGQDVSGHRECDLCWTLIQNWPVSASISLSPDIISITHKVYDDTAVVASVVAAAAVTLAIFVAVAAAHSKEEAKRNIF